MSVKKTAAVGAAVVGIVAAGAGTAMASSDAQGVAAGSPGVISGNQIQVPVHVPINLCGNTVNLVGALNPAFGNHCANVG
ncbi:MULTISPECIES: chaplin [Kitasatospora]|uniref:Chaplin n=1 Tax=Kitasatospora cathayae TaxID=3004092 RepID=A0ABY7Q6D3_9ACTN|nr:chaplin [Kitasatospora sp. HUAS 3-15]WBP88255.1 chaplin [Kitasatospora sp. HUAS 3-15]